MGTHTFTRLGVVDNSDLRQIMYAFGATYKDFMDKLHLLALLKEDENYLLMTMFFDEVDHLVRELQTLLALTRTYLEYRTPSLFVPTL